MRVLCDQDGSVWRITLEPSPGSERVAFDGPGLDALHAVSEQAEASSEARVVVLEGQPGAFCHGIDLRFVSTGRDDYRRGVETFARCLHHIRDLPQAVICAVDGEAVAGGVGMAAAGDLMLITERSTFQLPELAFGLVPGIIMPLLRNRIHLQRVRWMALTGARLDATEAKRIGLADELVPDGAALAKAERRLIKQLLRSSPRAVARMKRLCSELPRLTLSSALDMGVRRTADDIHDQELLDAIQGLIEGELPPWFEKYKRPKRGKR